MANFKVYSPDLDGEQIESNMDEDGNAITLVAATADQYLNNGRVILLVETSSGTGQEMQINSTFELSGLPLTDRTVTLTPSQTHIFGPYPPNVSNDEGYTEIEFNAAAVTATVEVTVIRLT